MLNAAVNSVTNRFNRFHVGARVRVTATGDFLRVGQLDCRVFEGEFGTVVKLCGAVTVQVKLEATGGEGKLREDILELACGPAQPQRRTPSATEPVQRCGLFQAARASLGRGRSRACAGSSLERSTRDTEIDRVVEGIMSIFNAPPEGHPGAPARYVWNHELQQFELQTTLEVPGSREPTSLPVTTLHPITQIPAFDFMDESLLPGWASVWDKSCNKIRYCNKATGETTWDKPLMKPDEGECCVCMAEKCDVNLVPCGHGSFCGGCAQRLNHCPLCRSEVTEIGRIVHVEVMELKDRRRGHRAA